MTERPALPPLLRPLAVPPDLDPFARGIKVAGEGEEQARLSRATGLGKHVEIRFDDQVRTGTFKGLTESGAMRLVGGEVAQTIALDEAMKTPTWSI